MISSDDPRPLYLLSDEPLSGHDRDHLGRQAEARLIASAILGNRGPFTIGIFGDWGIGKTSLLHKVGHLLADAKDPEGKPRYPYLVPVFFNAWQHEREAEPLAFLAAEVRDAIAVHLKRLPGRGVSINASAVAWLRAAHHAARALVYSVSVEAGADPLKAVPDSPISGWLSWLPFFKFSAKDAIDRYESLRKEQGDPGSKAWEREVERSASAAALRSLRIDDASLGSIKPGEEGEVPRVVVFVDDLDRCAAKEAVALLQSLKLALAQPGFIFVITLNPDALRPFVRELSKDRGHAESGDVIYLDKLVQLPFPLRLRGDQFGAYCTAVIDQRLKGVYEGPIHEALADLRPALRDASGHNPRSFKRLINTVLVESHVAGELLRDLAEGSVESPLGIEVHARAKFLRFALLYTLPARFNVPDALARLSASSELCEEIVRIGLRALKKEIAAIPKPSGKMEFGSSDSVPPRIKARREFLGPHADLIAALDQITPLDGLFKQPFGKEWLGSPHLRQRLDLHFAMRPAVTIEEEPPPAASAKVGPSTVIPVTEVGEDGVDEYEMDAETGEVVGDPSAQRKKRRRPIRAPQKAERAERRSDLKTQIAIIERAARENLGLGEEIELTPKDWSGLETIDLTDEPISDAAVRWLIGSPNRPLKSLKEIRLQGTSATLDGIVGKGKPETLPAFRGVWVDDDKVSPVLVERLGQRFAGIRINGQQAGPKPKA